MNRSFPLALFLVVLYSTVSLLHAQDTCRSIYLKNPHGAAMNIEKVWILDSVNFTVESLRPLPYYITDTGTVDFKVCILPRDGIKRTTQVRYLNTHGTSSYSITMTPPATESVKTEPQLPSLIAFPNPASTSVELLLAGSVSALKVECLALDGTSFHIPFTSVGKRVTLQTTLLASGSYTIIVKDGERPIGMSQIVITH